MFNFFCDLSDCVGELATYGDTLLVDVLVVNIFNEFGILVNGEQNRRLNQKIELIFKFLVVGALRRVRFILSSHCSTPVVGHFRFLHDVEFTLSVDKHIGVST